MHCVTRERFNVYTVSFARSPNSEIRNFLTELKTISLAELRNEMERRIIIFSTLTFSNDCRRGRSRWGGGGWEGRGRKIYRLFRGIFYSSVLESFFGTLHGSVQFLLPLFLLPLSLLSLDLALAIVHPVLRDVS